MKFSNMTALRTAQEMRNPGTHVEGRNFRDNVTAAVAFAKSLAAEYRREVQVVEVFPPGSVIGPVAFATVTPGGHVFT